MGRTKRKPAFRHVDNEGLDPAVWSRPSLSANRIIGSYRMFGWREKNWDDTSHRMIWICTCDIQRYFFAWHGPYGTELQIITGIDASVFSPLLLWSHNKLFNKDHLLDSCYLIYRVCTCIYYQRLLIVEFDWDPDHLSDEPPVEGPPIPITIDMIKKAISQMKAGKAPGPSGIVVEMIRAAGYMGAFMIRDLAAANIRNGKVPSDWEQFYCLPLQG